jgi:hypothetical protein
VRLDDDQLVALADLIAERLRHAEASTSLLSAAELADRLGVSVKSVYARADDLGAIRVGRSVRFDPARALIARPPAPASPAAPTRPRRRRRASSGPLLPIRGGSS